LTFLICNSFDLTFFFIYLELNIRVANFEDFIESLNYQGYLLKKGNRVYKVQTSSVD